MACEYCFTDYISCGVSQIIIHPGENYVPIGIYTQNNAPQYTIRITHPNGSTWKVVVRVTVFGYLPIEVSSFPIGFFNPYAGAYIIEAIATEDCAELLFCEYYSSIQFEVVNGNEGKNTLTCCPPDSGNTPVMTCCTTETIPFTNVTSTTLAYTGTRPTIEVAYLNPDGISYTLGGMGIGTLITFTGTSFTIDHGGLASGLIKLLK
jgi:hypothetical protein